MKRFRKAIILLGVLFFTLLCCTPQVSAAKKPSLSKKSITLLKGSSITLKAKNFPGKVTWSSLKKSVATVKNGTVTAQKTGRTVITAKSGKTKLTCQVTVAKDPVMSAASLSLSPGETASLKLNSLAKGLKVTWKSSSKKVATVKGGKVTAVGEGKATITATVLKKKFTCSVTVKKASGQNSDEKKNTGDDSKSGSDPKPGTVVKGKKISSVKLDKSSLTLDVGENAVLKATVAPSDAANPELSWKSSDSDIAVVNAKGKVSAKKAGTVTITAAAQDGSGKKSTCKVTVKPLLVSSISLNKQTAVLNKYGEGMTLKATVSPSNASDKELTWSSSDSKVATVDGSGHVKAVGAGSAKITAAAKDGSGKKAVCTVEVVFHPNTVTGVVTSLQPGSSASAMAISLRITNHSCEDIFTDWILEAQELDCEEDLILVAEGYEAAWEKEFGASEENNEDPSSPAAGDTEEEEPPADDEDEEFLDDDHPAHETPFIKIGKGETKEITYREYNPDGWHQSASFTSDSFMEVGIEIVSGYSYLYSADLSVSSRLTCTDEEEDD